jgi:hypothetical protein
MIQSMPGPWRRSPKPDAKVVKAADDAYAAAQEGHTRLLVIVSVNPMLKVEATIAGDLNEVRKDLLIGALQRLILRIDRQEVSE